MGLVIELGEKDSKIESLEKKAIDNLHSITQLKEAQHNLNAESNKLEDALNDATLLGEDEPEDIAGMDRKGLVDKIVELEKNLVGASSHGFHNGVEQIKVVNPRVKISTEGIHFLKFVEGGVLVTPEDFEEDEIVDNAQALMSL